MDEVRQPRFPLLGLDISETCIGVALAETPPASPQPMFTHARITRARDLAEIAAWTTRYAAAGVVLGLPLNMDGSEGPRAVWMRRFARELETRLSVPVSLCDERLSTVEAEERLAARYVPRSDWGSRVDGEAAAIILERYLDGIHD
jgi:putative Holliday junction resolvase